MARRREAYGAFYEGDFGLSALAARVHASAGPVDPQTVLGLAADVAGLGEGEGAVELGTDLRLLLDSAVPDEALRTVWRAATGGRFDPAGHGMDFRGWLRRFAEPYPARARERDSRYGSLLTPPVIDEADLREDVVTEIRASAAEGEPSRPRRSPVCRERWSRSPRRPTRTWPCVCSSGSSRSVASPWGRSSTTG